MSGFQFVKRSAAPVGSGSRTIGNAWADGKGVCSPDADSEHCFLGDAKRSKLAVLIGNRANRAFTSYTSAINKVNVKELLRKPDDITLFGDLAIDVMGIVLGGAIGKAVKFLRGSSPAALAEAGVSADQVATDAVARANESNVSLFISTVTSLAKKGLKAPAVDGETLSADKALATTFLDQLEQAAEIAFDQLANDSPGSLTDPELILLYHSLAPERGNSAEDYKKGIEDMLARYRASPASKIGRHDARAHLTRPDASSTKTEAAEYLGETDLRDVKLVMHRFTDDSPPRLYYYKRDYRRVPSPGVDLHDPKTNLDNVARTDEFTLHGEVEPELMDIAIANNQQAWGVQYETKVLSTSPYRMPRNEVPSAPAPTDKPKARKTMLDDNNMLRQPIPYDSPVMNID